MQNIKNNKIDTKMAEFRSITNKTLDSVDLQPDDNLGYKTSSKVFTKYGSVEGKHPIKFFFNKKIN